MEKGDARPRLIEGFDDNVLELVAKKLLDGAFIFFLYFGVVGQQSNGAETARLRIVAGIEKLLDCVGGVGAVAEDFLDRRVSRALRGKRLPGLFELLRRLLLGPAKLDEACLRVPNGCA